MSPFGPYKDFEQCVRENRDKDSPEGYCSATHKKITGEWPGEKKSEDVLEKNAKYKTLADRVKQLSGEGRYKTVAERVSALQGRKLKPGTIKKAMDFVVKNPYVMDLLQKAGVVSSDDPAFGNSPSKKECGHSRCTTMSSGDKWCRDCGRTLKFNRGISRTDPPGKYGEMPKWK